MDNEPKFNRPPFNEALKAWKTLLSQRGFPADLLWIFNENLCFENAPASAGGFQLGFQTAFTPPPPDAEGIAYDYFSNFDAPLVFYRIGSCHGKSACLLLCDEWFEPKGETDGYVRRDEWGISFFPGASQEVEEIAAIERWKGRILRDRPLHALDFCMTLQAVHETLAHGRVLSTYERYGVKFLHLWRRLLGHGE